MGSYLDNRGPNEQFLAEKTPKALDPEELERRAAKKAGVDAALAEAALLQAGDPGAIAREATRQAQHDEQWEQSQRLSQEREDAQRANEHHDFADD